MIKMYSCYIMIKNTQEKARNHGLFGEKAAKNYLLERGYLILHTNFRSRFGEIDIIAEKNRTIVFVEVKTRTESFIFGLPEESFSRIKLRKIKCTIYSFFSGNPVLIHRPWRIDLITVTLNHFEETKRIVHYKNVEIY